MTNQSKGLILAQNERWRRGLGMQVERIVSNTGSGERGRNTSVTYPQVGDSGGKLPVIPDDVAETKGVIPPGGAAEVDIS